MKPWLWMIIAWLPLAALAAEPAEIVEHFHAALIDNMKQGAALSCSAREQRLEPVIAQTFATPAIARVILRRRWAQLTEPQRKHFAGALHGLVVRSYASNFRAWSGESFTTRGVEEQGATQRVVHARINRVGNDPVGFDYFMRQIDGQWRVINVVADGVSDLALRTAQYEKMFAEQGFDALVKWIEDQAHNDKDGC